MATARLMETWAHGQDVADALGRSRQPTPRLRHVAHIGVRTRDFAYLVRDLPVPAEPFRYELTAPDGQLWTWGPDDAGQRITGPALDFCLLVTQRRNPADLAVNGDRRRRRTMDRHRTGLCRAARRRPRARQPTAGRRASPSRAGMIASAPDVIRIGNASGFYGDRASAMQEMLTGGELDVLTGDYLAELTMLILGRDRLKDPSLGYAKTFLRQLESSLGTALERGVRIVTNAGGLNPAGLADAVRALAGRLGLSVRVAYVTGDDLRERAVELGLGEPLAANAYLGAWGIAAVPARRRRRRRHRPSHRRLARGRAGGRALRLDAGRLRRAGRRGGGRARDRVRAAGNRRQLLALRAGRPGPRPAPAPGLPDRRGVRRRFVGDHEASAAPVGWCLRAR